jgi:predicted amidohydrolase
MEHVLTVAVVNFHPVWGDKDLNLSRICGYVRAGARRGADIVLLPETALSGYSDDPNPVREEKMQQRLAEPIPGPATQAVCALTKQYGTYAAFGMPERDGTCVYNAAAVCLPDGTAKRYRKIHLPGAEINWAQRGEDPLLFDTPWAPVGVGICYDVFEYPELARYYRAKGARLLLNPCAVPTAVGTQHQNNSLRAAVTSSQLYIATANIFGPDADLQFQGASGVVGPGDLQTGYAQYAGKAFGAEGANQGEMYLATIDLSYTQQTGISDMFEGGIRTGAPDWRPDLYARWLEDVRNDPNWKAKFRNEGGK